MTQVDQLSPVYAVFTKSSSDLIDLGVKANVVEKSGAWFSYDSQRLGQGRENAKTFLKDNPEIAAEIEGKIRQNAGLLIAELQGNDDVSASEDAA